jgi:hypothetical protein
MESDNRGREENLRGKRGEQRREARLFPNPSECVKTARIGIDLGGRCGLIIIRDLSSRSSLASICRSASGPTTTSRLSRLPMRGISHSSKHVSVALRRLALPVLLTAAAAMGVASAPVDEAERTMRLRLEWTGDKPEVWAGVLETSEGTFRQPVSLGVGADQAGTLWEDGKSVWLGRRSPHIDDGFDVTLIAPRSARISFTLQSALPGGWRQQFEWTLSDIGAEPRLSPFGDRVGHLAIRRAPGDALHVAVDRPHLIYGPGEIFKAHLLADRPSTPLPAGAATLNWEVLASQTGKKLQSESLPAPQFVGPSRQWSIPVELSLPNDEGSFDIRFRLDENGSNTQESVVQILVLGDRFPAIPNQQKSDIVVDHFRRGDAETSRVLAYDIKSRSANSKLSEHALYDVAGRLPDAARGGHSPVNWIAYRLEVQHPQRPHRLVVEMASVDRQFVGIGVLEPNVANRSMPFTVESSATVGPFLELSSEKPSEASTTVRRQLLFWPRVREPVLLLHDMGNGRHIEIAKVEVHELSALPSRPSPTENACAERLVGPYLSKPTFVASFGAPQVADYLMRCRVDNWETFHTAALRAAECLRSHGDNALMLSVMADGATIYPSAFLEPSPRFDSGPLSSSGQDPMPKDVVELMYRVFDREGLVLIPELQFSAPLPALERQLAAGGQQAEGIELVGPDGRSWRESQGSNGGLAPYYNPLDPRVQTAVLDIVREFVERYRRHRSFRGVALEVDRSGYLQLPGLEWGCDEATLARFRHETGARVDGTPADNARGETAKDRPQPPQELLSGDARSSWINWRCAELAKFHRRLADAVASAAPQACLVLACKQVLSLNSETEMRREIRMRGRLGDLILQHGLDFSLSENVPHLVVLRTALWRTSIDPVDGILDDAVNDNTSVGSAFHGPESGVLAIHQPQEIRICGMAGPSPGRPTCVRLAVDATPGDQEYRRRFIRALTSSDAKMLFDGAWQTPLGQDDGSCDLRQIVRALPRIPFYEVDGEDHSAVVRMARRDKKTYIYVANQFAEPIQITIQLTCPAGTTCLPLGPSHPAAIEAAEGATSRLVTSLDGYGLAAWEIHQNDARVQGIHAELPSASLASLQAQIQRFTRIADVRLANQAQQAPARGPNRPTGPVALTAASDRSDQLGSELIGNQQPISGAAYWSFDRNGGRVNQARSSVGNAEVLSADDLRQLAKISLEIRLAWEEKRFAQCQRLLNSYWGRCLALESEGLPPKPTSRQALVAPNQPSR